MVTVEIPLKFRKWFEKHRELPVRVAITETSGMVAGGRAYRLQRIKSDKIVAYTCVGASVFPCGEITPHCIRRPISDAAKHDLGVLRAVLFDTTYPAPLAYEMKNRDIVHPGECFNKHPSVLIKRTLYSVGDDEAKCAICKETFE